MRMPVAHARAAGTARCSCSPCRRRRSTSASPSRIACAGERDGHEARAAHLVHRERGVRRREAGAEAGLARGRLPEPGADDVAHDHLLDRVRRDARARATARADRVRAELRRGEDDSEPRKPPIGVRAVLTRWAVDIDPDYAPALRRGNPECANPIGGASVPWHDERVVARCRGRGRRRPSSSRTRRVGDCVLGQAPPLRPRRRRRTVVERALRLYYASQDPATPPWARRAIYAGPRVLHPAVRPDSGLHARSSATRDDAATLLMTLAFVSAYVGKRHQDPRRARRPPSGSARRDPGTVIDDA